ncbi:hypothetical protein AYO20_00667 [Fonsecaea nubica]|uniref:Uncharacterized protein n=1 Tax=Fonsecaea nubica TaxID=856822 RepID=A0A178DEY9_9EURO|nr:hypothetical protein AYO20_00667 [Fonsecaea nubica]OAL40247.1 hypothetical protein AYO20_00667 [Fonsecaea nubica]
MDRVSQNLEKKGVRKQPATQYERPLRTFGPEESDTAFEDCTMVFSVDISGSTEGKILRQERIVVESVVAQVSQESRRSSCVIPWDSEAHEIITVDELDRLDSAGGTDPNAMLQSRQHLDVLRKADLWFLLTDGEIDTQHIQQFAAGLGKNGLHNKACVLILFGYHFRPPLLANISVGVSVFAAFPDCIFLFHDVIEGDAFVLQCKGCLAEILGSSFSNPIIDHTTTWGDLYKFDYAKLKALQVPPRFDIKANEVLLQDRRQVNLDHVFKGELTPEETAAIFSNHENLNSVLLTASSRGQDRDVTNWLLQQRQASQDVDIRHLKRKDVNGLAQESIQEIVGASIRNSFTGKNRNRCQSVLRSAHRANWLALADESEKLSRTNKDQDFLILEALEKMELVSRAGLNSPACLSPSISKSTYSPEIVDKGAPSIQTKWDPCFTATDLTTSKGALPAQLLVKTIRENYSYIPGFSVIPHTGLAAVKCPCCNDHTQTWALLLKAPPEGIHTQGFVPAHSNCQVKYALAMGGYPETDIVSAFICCDPCAFALLEHGTSPLNEQLTGALPLSDWFDDRENEQTWLRACAVSLAHRFYQDDIFAVMYAVLKEALSRIEAASRDQSAFFQSLLSPAMEALESRATVLRASGTRSSIKSAAIDMIKDGVCFQAPFTSRRQLTPAVAELLQHPLESFVILMKHISTRRLSLVFIRLLWQIMEDVLSLHSEARQQAYDYLESLEPQPTVSEVGVTFKARSYRYTLDISELVRRDVMSLRTIGLFAEIPDAWDTFRKHCTPALHSCLWKFAKHCKEDRTASVTEIFGKWLDFGDFVALCEDPTNETMVIRWAYSASGLSKKPLMRLGEFREANPPDMLTPLPELG